MIRPKTTARSESGQLFSIGPGGDFAWHEIRILQDQRIRQGLVGKIPGEFIDAIRMVKKVFPGAEVIDPFYDM